MRNMFAKTLTSLGQEDERIVLLSGDIGNNLFNGFKQIAPKRFYNCGVAEANMIGVAAGMALSGLKPVVYTITPFLTARCFEQLRIDVAYHEAPVVIVGTGSGLSYAQLGPTHHSLEDIAIMRTLPGMTVIAPADPIEMRTLLKEAFHHRTPVYFRIGKKGEPDIHDNDIDIRIGKVNTIIKGSDVAILGTGTIMPEVLLAATLLQQEGVSVHVASVHTIKPLDADYMHMLTSRFKHVVTIEEHGKIGGLGSVVAEWCVKHNRKLNHHIMGTEDNFVHKLGSQQYVRSQFNLTSKQIAESIQRAMLVAL